jgi:hypothetical protein
MFRYDSTQTTYKWVFLGGAPALASVVTSENTASVTYAALATAGPSITVARGGDYQVEIGAISFNTTNGDGNRMSFDVGGTGAVDGDGFRTLQIAGANSGVAGGSYTAIKAALGSATALVAKYKALTGGAAWFENRYMRVIPIRVI